MTAADVTTLTAAVDPIVIVGGIVALGAIIMAPRAAAWGIAQIKRMI